MQSIDSNTIPTILLVEDKSDIRIFMRSLLERNGLLVLEASDGEGAVQAALERRPDVILMDLGLPLLNGVDASRRIRQNPVTSSIPIIAVSAHGDVADWRAAALRAGCCDCLVKPVNPNTLLRLVQGLLIHQ